MAPVIASAQAMGSLPTFERIRASVNCDMGEVSTVPVVFLPKQRAGRAYREPESLGFVRRDAGGCWSRGWSWSWSKVMTRRTSRTRAAIAL